MIVREVKVIDGKECIIEFDDLVHQTVEDSILAKILYDSEYSKKQAAFDNKEITAEDFLLFQKTQDKGYLNIQIYNPEQDAPKVDFNLLNEKQWIQFAESIPQSAIDILKQKLN